MSAQSPRIPQPPCGGPQGDPAKVEPFSELSPMPRTESPSTPSCGLQIQSAAWARPSSSRPLRQQEFLLTILKTFITRNQREIKDKTKR